MGMNLTGLVEVLSPKSFGRHKDFGILRLDILEANTVVVVRSSGGDFK